MKKITIPIAIIVISFSLITTLTLTNPDQESAQSISVTNDSEIIPEGFVAYENEALSMAVNYPENWTIKYLEGNSSMQFVQHDVSTGDLIDNPLFGVLVIPTSDDIANAKQLMHAYVDPLESHESISDVEYTISDLSIGTMDATVVKLEQTVLNKKITMLSYYVDVDEKIYLISYTSPTSKYESHLDIAKEMFSSFRFI
ncbi:hypothetical protein K0U27_10685 [archaeon]|nr:hypothetical protein [archaeon]